MITIDNVTYDVGIIKITRKAQLNQESLGTTLDLRKHYDVRGTYYDYEVEFYTKNMDVASYDSLYEIITTPTESHTVTLPYGQNTLTFEAKLSITTDSVLFKNTQKTKWGGFKVTFESLTPQKEA